MENTTYIKILKDTLTKKLNCLDKIMEETQKQEQSLSLSNVDMEGFESSISKKDMLILQMNQLDQGFESVYQHVKVALKEDKEAFKEDILELQNLIKQLTEKSTILQTRESINKKKLEVYLSAKKKEVKEFKVSNQTVSQYYKNMSNQYLEESYFLDKKK